MEIVRCSHGDWMIVELGDAQVAGLPETLDVIAFYRRLIYVRTIQDSKHIFVVSFPVAQAIKRYIETIIYS